MSKKRRAKIPPFRVLNSENIFRKFVSKIMRSCDKNFAQLQVFPAVLLIHIFVKADLTLLYFGVMIVMGFLFISKIQIRKPENRQIALMILLGIVEFAALAIVLACVRR